MRELYNQNQALSKKLFSKKSNFECFYEVEKLYCRFFQKPDSRAAPPAPPCPSDIMFFALPKWLRLMKNTNQNSFLRLLMSFIFETKHTWNINVNFYNSVSFIICHRTYITQTSSNVLHAAKRTLFITFIKDNQHPITSPRSPKSNFSSEII